MLDMEAKSRQRAVWERWEHLVVSIDSKSGSWTPVSGTKYQYSTDLQASTVLSALGSDGWELVGLGDDFGSHHRYALKRRLR